MATERADTQGPRPSVADAKAALVTLLRYIGEDPTREGLAETPGRVIRAYAEFFGGYKIDPRELLSKSFKEVGGASGWCMLRGIRVRSHCEHHMVPFTGECTIGYLPNGKVVGISKMARVVDARACRLQVQERLTAEIADDFFAVMDPKAVGIVMTSQHHCMTTRGVLCPGVNFLTSEMRGSLLADAAARAEFTALLGVRL